MAVKMIYATALLKVFDWPEGAGSVSIAATLTAVVFALVGRAI